MSIYNDVDAFIAGLGAIVLTRLQRPVPPQVSVQDRCNHFRPKIRFGHEILLDAEGDNDTICAVFTRQTGRDLPLNKVLRLPFFHLNAFNVL
ncbi:hypothetical protein CEXT_279611 [Caerostris extrusa]|uniref:Uncharacterized protein n=1 Tax=Caerostris extrusa TaxID=172846 RepID=A0AAV4X0N5_CAEEX|nr:hypothetical protein CEXT_279611 [Caerostris extrusa]